MATETWLVPLVTAIMGGGIVGGLSQLWTAHATSRQVRLAEERAPTDVGMVLLGGASQAVTVLTNSLQWAQDELEGLKNEQTTARQQMRDLMASNNSKDARIAELERDLAELRHKMTGLQDALAKARAQINEMREPSNGQETT